MSPKSRGRPPGRGRPKGRSGPPRELSPAEQLVRNTRGLAEVWDDALVMESWASTVLGAVWARTPFGDDETEHRLLVDVAGLAARRRNPEGTVAAAALRLLADSRGRAVLDAALDGPGRQGPPLPPWAKGPDWTPVAAYCSLDVWGSERVLFVDFDGPVPHCLLAVISEVPSRWVTDLEVVDPGTAQVFDAREPGEAVGLQPVERRPVEEVLADLADAMFRTDLLRPEEGDPDYAPMRALAWSRCRPHLSCLPPRPAAEPTDEADRDELVDAFVGSGVLPDDATARALAELFVDAGDECLPVPPLGWNPNSVEYFLTDWLPSTVQLSAGERTALLGALRHWVAFALTRQGIAQEWIDPVVAAVGAYAAEFEQAYDEGDTSWLLVEQIADELAARGVDLSDAAAVKQALLRLKEENPE